jgi:hypothetical protein
MLDVVQAAEVVQTLVQTPGAHTALLLSAIGAVGFQSQRNRVASMKDLGAFKDRMAKELASYAIETGKLGGVLRDHIANTPTEAQIFWQIARVDEKLREESQVLQLDRDTKVEALDKRTRQLERNCVQYHDADVNGSGS